jgi:hypothetical protein
MSSARLPSDGKGFSSTADAVKRLEAIVEAAERAAATVIDDAEQEARRQLEEAHARADRIVAARLRDLADVLDPLDSGDGREPASSGRHELRLRSVEVEDEGERDGDRERAQRRGEDAVPAPRREAAAGARLLATQMAVSGAAREEIEERLRSGFEIEDPDAILDAILGPE